MIIAICGMSGSGKSTASEIFERQGFVKIHLGVTEEVIEKNGFTNEQLEREMRVAVRKEYGMGAMAIIALPRILKLLDEGKKVVIDNMYSWSEEKIFRKEFGEKFKSIAIHASPQVRYDRLETREVRGQDKETSRSRDFAEIEELEKGGPIAMGDYHVINETDYAHYESEIMKIIEEIQRA